jgi:hypothetical protein
MIRRSTIIALGALAAAVSASTQSQAHIDLLSPPPRAAGFPDSNLLRGPCGQRSDARVPAKVSSFRPGETIDVVWDVYVQHVSYFRISFDSDGDDSFSSRASAPGNPADDDLAELAPGDGEVILDYLEDPTADVDHVARRVTLPSEPCDNCTLQVTQFTYGLPVKDAVYFQCADLVLAGEPVLAAPSEPAASDAGAGPGDSNDGAAGDGAASGCSLAPPSRAASRARSSSPAGAASATALAALFAASAWRRRYRRAGSRSGASEAIHSPSSAT